MASTNEIMTVCRDLRDDMTAFLDELIRFESLAGFEGPAMHWLRDRFDGIADVSEEVPVPEEITADPEFSKTTHGQPYDGRSNVRAALRGDGSGRSVIFNTHVDVVPATKNQQRPFDPFIRDGAMYGRGACDAKGQVAVLWTVLSAMRKLGLKTKGDAILHIVIEEEAGGNGTLAMVRRGEKADCSITLEPCDNVLCTSVRGSVWFKGTCTGRAGHAGTAETTVSALMMAIEAIRIIGEYHDELLAETIGDDPLYAKYANPMPYNIGELHAGNWPSTAPERAEFTGMFGFLTTPRDVVMREIEQRIRTRGPAWLADHFDIEFPYRHEASRIDPGLPFARALGKSFEAAGISRGVGAVTSSMDTWLYSTLLGIPSLATGCGKLTDAHTIDEHIVLDDIVNIAAALVMFLGEWCGFRE